MQIGFPYFNERFPHTGTLSHTK